MKEACVKQVEDALQRALGRGEKTGIEDRVRKWMKLLAQRNNEEWRGLSGTQRLDRAAQAAANELKAEVAKSRQQVNLAIQAWDRAEKVLDQFPKSDYRGRLAALSRILAFDPSKAGPRAIESSAKAMSEEMRGKLMDAWKVAHPKFFGLFEHQQGLNDLIDEIHGKNTKNPAAKAGADAWRKTMDEARDRYNAAGGHMGTLGEQYFPNSHDKYKVGDAGFEGWFKHTEPLLDKNKYLNPDGSRLDPKDLKEFFRHAFQTIITDGDSKSFRQPNQGEMIGPEMLGQRSSGHGLFADRNTQHRQIFFKDGESFRAYQAKFGRQSFLSAMLEHVNRLARDTAVLEGLGPWAEQTFNALNTRESLAAKEQFTDRKSLRKIDAMKDFNDALWRFVSGSRDVVDSRVARAFIGYRNIQTGLKLGKVFLTAFGDEVGMMATAFANKLPYSEMLTNQIKMLNPLDRSDRSSMESCGHGLNSMIGSLNRYGAEDMGRGATGKFANFIMRITGAERMWDTRRQGVAATVYHAVGQLSRKVKSVNDLNEADHGMLARKGIQEAEWQTIRRAATNTDGMVTPHEIWAIPDEKLKDLGDPQKLKRDATTALGAHINEETGMGVMETGARQRAQVDKFMGGDENKVLGQVGRSVMLFKTFSASMVLKHWERMGSMQTLGSKAVYGTILAVYGTAIAAAINALVRPFVNGQDPPDMTKAKPWMAAMLRGGGLGFYGDFLYDQVNSKDQSIGAALGGTMTTDLQDIWNVTGGAAFKKAKGEKVDEGANLIRLARDNNPLLNVWYTSALWDHWLWYNAQEAVNPGYLDRMMDRQRTYGRQYFWNPHDALPQRGPNFNRVVGEE
jgi:hypothetical protein